MVPIGAQLQTPAAQVSGLTRPASFTGEVVYLYAFDMASEMTRQPVKELLGQPVVQFVVDPSKRTPRQLFFYRPQMVRLPPIQRMGPRGPIRIDCTIKLLPIGAISITMRVPFQVDRLDDLVAFHDLRYTDGSYLYDEVRQLAEDVRRELMPHWIRPVAQLGDEEAYTVFCIKAPLAATDEAPLSGEEWLLANRRPIASLLTEEINPSRLSDQEVDESTGRYLSYYEQDLTVIDWDAALILDESKYFDEILYIMELANLQLAELEAYDRILDDAVERSYRDLSDRRLGHWQSDNVQRTLQEFRIDLARLNDELSNITKFFGDWHLARIYQGLSARFHLAEWHQTIGERLKTLDDLYHLLRTDQMNRWMFILELTIVLLFVIDLVILVFGAGK